MKKPFLTGTSVYLRALTEDDLTDGYEQWFNDPEVCRFNSHHRFPNDRKKMEEYYDEVTRSGRHLVLGIVDKKTDSHIGNIALQEIDHINRSAEFAIMVGEKEFWGKGIGAEAGKLIMAHGFDSLNLHRIYCGTSVENVGMQKLADSLGFKKEGVSREALFKEGEYRNVINYGALAHEFKR